jgi:hypothetical protein
MACGFVQTNTQNVIHKLINANALMELAVMNVPRLVAVANASLANY